MEQNNSNFALREHIQDFQKKFKKYLQFIHDIGYIVFTKVTYRLTNVLNKSFFATYSSESNIHGFNHVANNNRYLFER